jgi:hypothetical protein
MDELEPGAQQDDPSALAGTRQAAQRRRDAAFGRLRRARVWLVLGAAGLTAGFTALVADVAPGRAEHAPAAGGGSGSLFSPGGLSQGAAPGPGPSAPTNAPPQPAVSGGS